MRITIGRSVFGNETWRFDLRGEPEKNKTDIFRSVDRNAKHLDTTRIVVWTEEKAKSDELKEKGFEPWSDVITKNYKDRILRTDKILKDRILRTDKILIDDTGNITGYLQTLDHLYGVKEVKIVE